MTVSEDKLRLFTTGDSSVKSQGFPPAKSVSTVNANPKCPSSVVRVG